MNDRRVEVLVVEDDQDIREIVIETLEEEGYCVRGATNGLEALAYLRSGAALPCVILLDVMMPMMDGRAFRRAQLDAPELASIPVVVMTAHADVSTIAGELHAQFHLKKPVQLAQLYSIAKQFCRGPGDAASP